MRRVALLLISLTTAVAVAELALHRVPALRPRPRWYVGEQVSHPSRNFAYDSSTGWRLAPRRTFVFPDTGRGGAPVTSNAQGMRDPEDFQARCTRPRIVLIGDSFFFGSGLVYEQTIGAQLEDSLHHEADVYNLGMPGFGIDQMYVTLRHNALGFCPSWLVVGFIDDDWDRSLSAFRSYDRWMSKPTFVVDGDSLRPAGPTDRPGVIVRATQRHSSLGRLAELAMRRRAYTGGTGNWWQLNTMLLSAMIREAGRAGVPILFVRLPTAQRWRAFPALGAWMAATAVPYADLADPALKRDDIHLASNGHLNELGSAYVAGTIVRWLRTSLRTASAVVNTP